MTAVSGLVLLDTNVVLFLVRGNDFGRRIDAAYNLRQRPERPLISVVNVGELLGFARYRNWGEGLVTRLRAFLDELVIVDINEAVVEKYAFFHRRRLRSARRRAPQAVTLPSRSKVVSKSAHRRVASAAARIAPVSLTQRDRAAASPGPR